MVRVPILTGQLWIIRNYDVARVSHGSLGTRTGFALLLLVRPISCNSLLNNDV